MSTDKSVEYIKEYLREWIDLGKCPDILIGLDMIDLNLKDEKDLVYQLGVNLYFAVTDEKYQGKLNHKKIKKPRLYQFLKMVLREDKTEIESNPDFLLSILEEEKRDLIKEERITDEYTIDCFSTLGLTRLQNQDYVDCYQFDNALALMVADGVGGAESGEIASKITIEFILNSLKKYDFIQENNVNEILREILFEANQNVLNYAKKHNMGRMGTTLSLALIVEQFTLYIAHVGDSRIYEYNRGKKPRQITPDHSEIEMLIREGKVKEEDRENHKKNILRYAIGIENLKKEYIFVQNSVIRGDTSLLLCSDGLWEKIDIDKQVFFKSVDELENDIYAVVPTDNVTVLRYFSIEQELDDFEMVEEDFNEPLIKENSQESEPEEEVEGNLTSVIEKSPKKMKLNKKFLSLLLTLLLGICLIGFYLINTNIATDQSIENQTIFFRNVKNGDINETNRLIKMVDINIVDENNHSALYYSYQNRDISMSLFLIEQGIDTTELKKQIDFDINKTGIELQKLKKLKKGFKIL